MDKRIGPSFEGELRAAGLLGLPFTWNWDGGIAFGADITAEQQAAIAAVYDAHDPDAVPAATVPHSVTMRQACQALILSEKMDAVNAALAAIPGLDGELARAEWERSQVVERNRPLVKQMGVQLGLSDADLDQLFILAATL